jgi:hypothetical protein
MAVRENIRLNREIEDHAAFARKLATGVLNRQGAMQRQGNPSATGRGAVKKSDNAPYGKSPFGA